MQPWNEDWLKLVMEEDLGDGDHTSLACIPADSRSRAVLIAKEVGVLAGMDEATQIFHALDPSLDIDLLKEDGQILEMKEEVFYVEGSSRSILAAERTVLNVIQRMSGIATTTRRIADIVAHTKTKILDTRKTTPGMRELEKKAVVIGGGSNHRFGLFDMIMIKDNHVDFSGGITKAVKRTEEYLDKNKKDLRIEVETRNMDEVREVLGLKSVNRIMLDNFTPEELREAIREIDGRMETEASGGITDMNVVDYAETGVDYISMGMLTHSVKSLDLSLKAKII
jgi:nicotinate-nucleotide pyrophosphorylase (carboxylating)